MKLRVSAAVFVVVMFWVFAFEPCASANFTFLHPPQRKTANLKLQVLEPNKPLSSLDQELFLFLSGYMLFRACKTPLENQDL